MQKVKDENIVKSKGNKLFWAILFLVIALLSILTITKFNKNFSFSMFVEFLKNASFGWLLLACFCVFFFVLFEGLSLRAIYKSFGYEGKKSSSFVYSAADIYFSAITPSASGGQPASAYFMLKDGIPLPVVTVSLLFTLLMYSCSIILVVLFGFLFHPSFFLDLDFFAKLLILIGFIVQFGLVFCFYCLLYKDRLLNKICSFFLRWMSKLHLVHSVDDSLEKLNRVMVKYQESVRMVQGKKRVLVEAFLYNLLQRLSQVGVIVFVFLATGGELKEVTFIFALQSLVIMGSYAVPIPGAIGVTDYLMLQGFGKIMATDQAINLELLSRGLSFYVCIVVCGLVVLVRYLFLKRSSKK